VIDHIAQNCDRLHHEEFAKDVTCAELRPVWDKHEGALRQVRSGCVLRCMCGAVSGTGSVTCHRRRL
jgi:hypothetical protein